MSLQKLKKFYKKFKQYSKEIDYKNPEIVEVGEFYAISGKIWESGGLYSERFMSVSNGAKWSWKFFDDCGYTELFLSYEQAEKVLNTRKNKQEFITDIIFTLNSDGTDYKSLFNKYKEGRTQIEDIVGGIEAIKALMLIIFVFIPGVILIGISPFAGVIIAKLIAG